MIILQIAPVIGVGTGVGAVAHHLEQEWLRMGHDVRRLELADTGGSWMPIPGPGLGGKLALLARVVWFSTAGTLVARRRVARLPPGSVTVCHNDALVGDVYVNHGVLQASLDARGHRWLRMLRNPLHVFITARDVLRYRGRFHKAVVNLTRADDEALRHVHPQVRPRTWVIGNGVDIDHFRPPTPEERTTSRAALGLRPDDLVTVFVGHEYARKGLYPLLEAIGRAGARHHLLVVGGDQQMTDSLRERAVQLGCADRCQLLGVTDPRPALWAGDVLAQPSAYESYGLVVTEALACGLPVISTPVGVAPDVIVDGQTGYLTDGSVGDLATRLHDLAAADREAMGRAARQVALGHAWSVVARAYLDRMQALVEDCATPAVGA